VSFLKELKRRNFVRVGVAYGVATWLLIQVTDTVFPRIGLPDSAVTLVIALLGIGFIPALIFAWAFEMTPEGIKREKDVDRTESITPHTGKKLDRVIMGIMAAVIVFLLADRFLFNRGGTSSPAASQETTVQEVSPEPSAPSVAVLPFVNMSGNADNEYFSDGLTETLLHMLAQLPELKVAARTSSFAFKGQNTSVTEIAASLGVAHILEGSVQRAGERVRVTAQLIRAEDGFHVWSQNYDRTLEDIFSIQDEIATDVVTALDASLLGNQKLASLNTHDLDAYDSYLRALEQQAVYTYSSMAEAESLLKQSLAEDSGFIDAKLSLARNYLMMLGTGLIDVNEAQEKAAPLLEQVTSEQPDNRLARALSLLLSLNRESVVSAAERNEAIDELISLMALVPTETYIRSLVAAWLDSFYNNQVQALDLINGGLLVDPMSAFLHSRKGQVLAALGRLDEAQLSTLRAIELEPGYASAYSKMAGIMGEKGNLPAKLDWFRKAIEADPQDHELSAELATDLYLLGLPEEGDRWANRVMALAPGSDVARMTQVYGFLAHGNPEAAEAMARSMIDDQVSARMSAIWDASFIYHQLVSNGDRDHVGLAFLEGVRPDIADFSVLPKDQQGTVMQWVSIMFAHRVLGAEESQKRWSQFRTNLETAGAGWQKDDPFFRMLAPLFEGDHESAVKIALEDGLSEPVADWIGQNDAYRLPMFEPLLSDPRIAARLAERDRELAQAKQEVLAMLRQPEWQ
jgi:TolB-like protein